MTYFYYTAYLCFCFMTHFMIINLCVLQWSVCQLHLWRHHKQDIDLLTCGICHTYKTCTEQRLLVHQKIHSEERNHTCKVGGCLHHTCHLLVFL